MTELYVPEGRRLLPPGGEVGAPRLGDGQFPFPGGESAFSGDSDLTNAPRDARDQIASGAGSRFALAGAKCERRLPARYGPAPEVPRNGVFAVTPWTTGADPPPAGPPPREHRVHPGQALESAEGYR